MSLSSLGAGANVRSRRRGADLGGEWLGKGRNPGTFPGRGVLGRWDTDLGFRNIPRAELGPSGVRA